jgi:hypothetical protein
MKERRAAAKHEIDELTRSFFALFSNREGVLHLERIHALFVEGGVIAKCVGPDPEVTTLEAFIAPRITLLSGGTLTDFAEEETSETTQINGHIAQRLSTYRKSGVLNGVHFQTDGVKIFQFVETTAGWRILSMAWDDET